MHEAWYQVTNSMHVLNPIDPNPAIAAHAVFPQSGHSRPEKQPFSHIFPHFSKIEPIQKFFCLFFLFLYRCSSSFISWSSTQACFWITGAPSVQGAFPVEMTELDTVHFRCCHPWDSNPNGCNANIKCT